MKRWVVERSKKKGRKREKKERKTVASPATRLHQLLEHFAPLLPGGDPGLSGFRSRPRVEQCATRAGEQRSRHRRLRCSIGQRPRQPAQRFGEVPRRGPHVVAPPSPGRARGRSTKKARRTNGEKKKRENGKKVRPLFCTSSFSFTIISLSLLFARLHLRLRAPETAAAVSECSR